MDTTLIVTTRSSTLRQILVWLGAVELTNDKPRSADFDIYGRHRPSPTGVANSAPALQDIPISAIRAGRGVRATRRRQPTIAQAFERLRGYDLTERPPTGDPLDFLYGDRR